MGHVYLRWIFLAVIEGLALYIPLFCAVELTDSKTLLLRSGNWELGKMLSSLR